MSERFDLQAFIDRSAPLDLSGIDWAEARRRPVSEAERRILPFFIDVESYTIAYLRALLNTSAIEDPEIADFLPIRIMRDEARHFSFYYHKAQERLRRSKTAQRLTEFLVRRFWKPVGAGSMPAPELDYLSLYMFDGPEGRAEVGHIDRTIARLPGMGSFDGMGRFIAGAVARARACAAPGPVPPPAVAANA